MSAHIVQTIADLERKVEEHEASAARIKATINDLCQMAGIPVKYQAESLGPTNRGVLVIRSDQFHARPVATIVREYLEMRRAADLGPATIEEIFGALTEGGYEFQTKSDQMSRMSLYNAISKNPIFYKLPNKRWGLLVWYPKAKRNNDDESEDETIIGSAQAIENRERREREEAARKAAEAE